MAFAFNCVLEGVEFRAVRSGTGRDSGQPWMSLVLEDADSQQVEVSVPRDFQGDVYSLGLRKGDSVDVAVRAVARNDGNSYVQLRALPELVEDEG